jgi:sporulation protein YlmC with PRC-barrel domain
MRKRFPVQCAVAALFLPAIAAQTNMPSHVTPMTGTFLSVQSSNQWRSTQMLGMPVFDRAGEKIGSIGDLVIGQDGAIQAIVIALGGFLGVGEKNIAVSLREMTISRDGTGDRATVKLSKPEIERAPGFQIYTGKAVKPLPPI